jgi:hypothetical protein
MLEFYNIKDLFLFCFCSPRFQFYNVYPLMASPIPIPVNKINNNQKSKNIGRRTT